MDSPEDLEARHKESLDLKTSANQRYVSNEFEEAVSIYSEALDKCPFKFKEDRAIFYSNRAAAKLKMVSNIDTRIMINKGMFNKGKYWIFGKNKGVSVSNFEEPKGRNKGIQYWISF